MTWLTTFAIARSRVTIMAVVTVIVAGVLAFMSLPKAEDPPFTMRTVIITTPFPGASPGRVEQLVTTLIEESLQEIPEVDEINSVSRAGVSIVIATIADTVPDLAPSLADVQDAVDDVQIELPTEAHESNVNTDVAQVYKVLFAVRNDGFPHSDLIDAADEVKEALLRVSGVSEVEIFGQQERQIQLQFDAAMLSQSGLSPDAIAGALIGANILTPGGEITVGTEVLTVEPSGSFESVRSIRELTINLPTGGIARLGDLVDIVDTFESPAAPSAYFNGQQAVMVGASTPTNVDGQVVGVDARAAVARVAASLPLGLELEEVSFLPDDTQARIGGFMSNIGQSVAIVFVVILLFLGVRTGALVSATIPLVMLCTLALMGYFGVGINQMSLAALLLALGMLVDNAIVMSETTTVRAQSGEPLAKAVVSAAGELWLPLLISSLTTCAAFLPVYLAPGQASEFVSPIFMVVVMALMSSWVVALTVLPALMVLFLKVPATPSADLYNTPLYDSYRRILRSAIRYRWLTMATAVIFLVAVLSQMGNLRQELFAPSDNPIFTAEITLPQGIPQAEAERTLREVHGFFDEHSGDEQTPGIAYYASMLGEGLPRFALTYGGPDKATGTMAFYVRTTDRETVDRLIPDFIDWTESHIVGARVEAGPLVAGPGGGADVGITLSSVDDDALWTEVGAATAWLNANSGVRNVRDDWGSRSRKLNIAVDPVRLRLAGVTNQDVASSLLRSLSGVEISDLRVGEDKTPIILRASGDGANDLTSLRNLRVFGGGESVALQQVANIDFVLDYAQIRRADRIRTVEVSADTAGAGLPADVQSGLLAFMAERADAGVKIEGAGALSTANDANETLMANVPTALLVIMLLLVFQFNSFRRMLVNVGVLPFSLIGVVLTLLLFDAAMGFLVLLAMISLFGILLNNGIVLIDRIDVNNDAGMAPLEAIVEACVVRVRPISMSVITTVSGLIPLYLGGGSTFEGLALALMGGLGIGTVLTLILVPVGFATLFGVKSDEVGLAAV